MSRHNGEGIIIGTIPFRDYDCILTVFTPNEGLIKLMVRAAYSSKNGKGSGITNPLSNISFVYKKGDGELHACHEVTATSQRLDLRKDLPTLQAACDMLELVSSTQQPGKSAPELYSLITLYLQKLPTVSRPAAIAASFKLKLLRYEGLLSFLSHCCTCASPLVDCHLAQGEVYCTAHATRGGVHLTAEERIKIELLAFSRSFSEIADQEIEGPLILLIEKIFNDAIGAY